MKNVLNLLWQHKEYIAIAIIVFFVFRSIKKGMNIFSGKDEKPSKVKKEIIKKKGATGKILDKDLYRKVAADIRKMKGVSVEPTFYNAKEIAASLSLYDSFLNPDKSRSFLKEIMKAQSKAAVAAVAHEYFIKTKRDINILINKMDNESISELVKYVNGLPLGINYTK